MKWRDVELLSGHQAVAEEDKQRIFSQNATELFKR